MVGAELRSSERGAVAADCEIVVHGTLDAGSVRALSGFTHLTAEGLTVLRGTIATERDLAAILDAFASLGLGLHSLRLLPEPESMDAVGHPPRTP
jgi:hypothetical protein